MGLKYSLFILFIGFFGTSFSQKVFNVSKTNGAFEQFEGVVQDGDTIKNGFYYYFSDSTSIYQSGTYVNGEMGGLWLIYYNSGRIKSSFLYRGGEKSGVFAHFYPNGTEFQTGFYKADSLHGRVLSFNQQNVLIEINHYNLGVKVGIDSVFYDHGKLKRLSLIHI